MTARWHRFTARGTGVPPVESSDDSALTLPESAATTRQDWRVLGARIRRAALLAATLHLAQTAGGRLDDGIVSETPRVSAGG